MARLSSALLLALAACADAHEAAEHAAPKQPTFELLGDFRYAYITAGTNSSHGRFLFADDGTLRIDTQRTWGSPLEMAGTCSHGSYTVTPSGMVHFAWEDGSERIERAHPVAVIDARALADERGWGYYSAAERYWARRGFVAVDASLQRFEGGGVERASSDQAVRHQRSSSVAITFSSPLGSLATASRCELVLAITVEALIDSQVVARSAQFELPCSLLKRSERLMEIVVSGFRSESEDEAEAEPVPLSEAPTYGARAAWKQHLDEQGYDALWPEALYGELVMAFSPDLLFDVERPEVLVPRDLSLNAPVPDVYAALASGTPPEWWSSCPASDY